MNITDLIEAAHANAVRKGWYDPPKTFPEELFMIAGEVHEAGDEFRNGHAPNEVYWKIKGYPTGSPDKELTSEEFQNLTPSLQRYLLEGGHAKPEGVPIELADVLIRTFDTCGARDIDLVKAIRLKMHYNSTRPYRHGGKAI